jgi:hypothetical protein
MKDDKKKLAIIALLGVVILAVGAFQFLGDSKPPPQASDTQEEKSSRVGDSQDPEDEGRFLIAALPQRDPFKAAALPSLMPEVPVSAPQAPPSQPPTVARQARPSGYGEIPPYNPLQGNLLPDSGGQGLATAFAPPQEDVFSYRVSGLIVGRKPVAVFTDAQGIQRLVPLGGSLDGDTQVVAIDRGKVTVRYKGKTLTLTPGGNPSDQ